MAGEKQASFGGLLRQFRDRAKLSQEELAEKAGLSLQAIGALEREERKNPRPRTVRTLAKALSLKGEERAAFFGAVPSRSQRGRGPASEQLPPIGESDRDESAGGGVGATPTDSSAREVPPLAPRPAEGATAVAPQGVTATGGRPQPQGKVRRRVAPQVQRILHPPLPATIMITLFLLSLITGGVLWLTGRAALQGARTPTAGPIASVELQQFGSTFAPVGLTLIGNEYAITPPRGDLRYAHLWGAYQPGERCNTAVEFDARIDGDTSSLGFGYAVAPRGTIVEDQPSGFSVQFEWDGSSLGYFIRPALLPSGARSQGEMVVPTSDIRQWHHVRVVAHGGQTEVFVDRSSVTLFRSAVECGGIILRVWDGTLHLRNLTVSSP